jgi:nucleotide sugar dehydrogenase
MNAREIFYSKDLENMRRMIKDRKVLIGVIGLGSIGAVVASAFLFKGFKVVGIDKRRDDIVRMIKKKSKDLHQEDVVRKILMQSFGKKFFVEEPKPEVISDLDVYIVIVPVEWRNDHVDTSVLEEVSKIIGRNMRRGSLFILESSVPPGTTRRISRDFLERFSGMIAGEDFGVAYSPERVSLGRAFEDLVYRYPKIVSGINDLSLEAVENLYNTVVEKGVLRASSLETAEFTKLIEGVYRDVNIALANSLAEIASLIGVDFWEARELANTQPYSHIHMPGTGVGGVCLPNYPWFLISLAEVFDKKCWCRDIIKIARDINSSQPKRVVEKIIEGLNMLEIKDYKNVKICILGLSYRGDIYDIRGSPSIEIARSLREKGFEKIFIHEPYLSKDNLDLGDKIVATKDLEECIRGSNVILISTDHSVYKDLDIKKIKELAEEKKMLIYDGRNMIKTLEVVDRETEILYGGVGKSWRKL